MKAPSLVLFLMCALFVVPQISFADELDDAVKKMTDSYDTLADALSNKANIKTNDDKDKLVKVIEACVAASNEVARLGPEGKAYPAKSGKKLDSSEFHNECIKMQMEIANIKTSGCFAGRIGVNQYEGDSDFVFTAYNANGPFQIQGPEGVQYFGVDCKEMGSNAIPDFVKKASKTLKEICPHKLWTKNKTWEQHVDKSTIPHRRIKYAGFICYKKT